MTRLVSKWATDDSLVSAALEQDKMAKPSAPSASIAAPKTNKLVSKWANAADPQPDFKTSPKKENKQLLTPPSSAGNGNGGRRDRTERRKSEGKTDRGSFSHGAERRNSRGNAHKVESSNPDVSGASKNPYADSGRSLASRLGSMDVSNNHSNQRDGNPKKGHAGRGSRDVPQSPDKNTNHASDLFDKKSEDDHPRGPMTAAAKSFALRLGVPVKESASPQKPYNSHQDRHTAPRNSHGNGASKHEKTGNSSPTSRYMTPKQKRALEEQGKREQLSKEQELKEAKLKEEVKHLFEKMSDKSTSWADLEDESD